jgi:outer membrane protein assembly factor BamB
MLKKAFLAASALAVAAIVVAIGLYAAGVRVERDGTGKIPRFFSVSPDYDALEADRARQRQQPVAAAPADPPRAAEPSAAAAVVPSTSAASADVATAAPAAAPASAWPDFRGPNRDGRYDTGLIRVDWPKDGLPLLWKQPVGLGYASFVVAGGRAFTIEQRRRQEVASAYDVETGRELWTNGWDAEFIESLGGNGPRATPTFHDGRLYVLGAAGEFRCLNAATGAVIWRRNILDENGASNLDWGMAASPLIVDDTVVVLPGGSRGKSVVAYNRMTGEPVWSALDDRQAYTSPMLATIAGVRQILVVSATRAMGITPGEGRLLWEYPWATSMGINVAQPVLLEGGRIFLSAGYDHGAVVFEVTRDGDSFTARTIWENRRMKNKFTTSVLRDGYLYGLDEAILACVDARTGDLKWKGGRYGYGQVLLAGDHLIVLTEDGDVVLVKATPERHQELARFTAIDGKTWNHPVVADGRLLVRNIREMAAFDIRVR